MAYTGDAVWGYFCCLTRSICCVVLRLMIRAQQPKPAWCLENCGYTAGTGFAPDESWSKASTAKIALLLEALGSDEEFYSRPLTGNTGKMFFRQFVLPTGLTREDVFIANTIRCHPPGNRYPTGKDKLLAESSCRRWDAALDLYNPTVIGCTYHPADLFDEKQRFTLVRLAIQRAVRWHKAGERPLLLMGQRAMNVFMPHLVGTLKRWQNHWERGIIWKPLGDPMALVEIEALMAGAPEYRS